MRLHVGNGSVLLRNWVNIDLPLPNIFLVKERPDLAEKFMTTEDDYYGRHKDKNPDKWRKGAIVQETVTDCYGSFGFLPVRNGSVEEIWSVQSFEHLGKEEARAAVSECSRALKSGGFLRLDVPDPDATIREYRKTGDEWLFRHLFGPRLDVYGGHTYYNRAMLKSVVEKGGLFKYVAEEPNIHENYPAFCLRFRRI